MELGTDLDIGQYVASGVVAFDLHRRTIKWSQVRARSGCQTRNKEIRWLVSWISWSEATHHQLEPAGR